MKVRIRRLAANEVLTVFLASMLLFWLPVALFEPGHWWRDVFYSMAMGMAIVILVRIGPGLWGIIREGRTDAAAIQTMVIFLTWTVLLASRVLAWVNNELG